jgi:hypothetical protein
MTQILVIEGDEETIAKLREKLDSLESLRVCGLFHLMKSRCDCPDERDGRHSGKITALGPRFRWFVHRKCGKPTRGTQVPKNLLRRDELKPWRGRSGPEVVIDSLFMHDYGTERGES